MTKRLVGLIVITLILGAVSLVLSISGNVKKVTREHRAPLEKFVPARKPVTKNQVTNSGPVKISMSLAPLQVQMGDLNQNQRP